MARALALLALFLAVPASAHAASISGTVFHDHDADGTRASSEGPVAGVTVSIAGVTATSGDDGSWAIHGLEPGTHRVVWTAPAEGACTTLGCVIEVAAGSAAVDLGVQLGGLLLDPGGASGIGRAQLVAPLGRCVRRAFPARVTGAGITRVEYRVDGRRVAVGRRGFRARIPVRGLRPGSHRLTAVVAYGSDGGSPFRLLRARFRRCA